MENNCIALGEKGAYYAEVYRSMAPKIIMTNNTYIGELEKYVCKDVMFLILDYSQYEEIDDNGRIGYLLFGKNEGKEILCPFGPKIIEIDYRDGVKHGLEIYWDPGTGRIKTHSQEYKNGYKDGKLIYWNSDGSKSMEGEYKDNKQEGKWTYWYPNGKVKMYINYKNGLKDGISMWFDIHGKEEVTEYKNGMKVSEEPEVEKDDEANDKLDFLSIFG